MENSEPPTHPQMDVHTFGHLSQACLSRTCQKVPVHTSRRRVYHLATPGVHTGARCDLFFLLLKRRRTLPAAHAKDMARTHPSVCGKENTPNPKSTHEYTNIDYICVYPSLLKMWYLTTPRDGRIFRPFPKSRPTREEKKTIRRS